jgi:hypothetical protein
MTAFRESKPIEEGRTTEEERGRQRREVVGIEKAKTKSHKFQPHK